MYQSHIKVVRLGVVLAIIMFVSLLFVALLSKSNYGGLLFSVIQSAYPGCNNQTFGGILLCSTLGAVDGFLGGVFIALLYNSIPINV
jgi:hypothetical protein